MCDFNAQKLTIISDIVNIEDEKILSLIQKILSLNESLLEEIQELISYDRCWCCYEKGSNSGCKSCRRK